MPRHKHAWIALLLVLQLQRKHHNFVTGLTHVAKEKKHQDAWHNIKQASHQQNEKLHHATVTKLCSSVKQFSVNESAKHVALGCKGICSSRHHQDKERERERETGERREEGGGGGVPKAKLCFLREWTKQVAFGCNEMCSK